MTALTLKHNCNIRPLFFMLAAVALAGCSTERGGFGSLLGPQTAEAPAKPAKPAPPPINMGGRWTLSSPGAGQCGMTLTTRGNGFEGSVAPEGGCPGEFFTSRSWALERGFLIIKNHKGNPLARLAASNPPGSFQGNAGSGIPLTLTR